MEYYFAPLEGVSGGEYRRVHYKHFAGADKYYMPFISPTQDHIFTHRELRNIGPEVNAGIPAVPQLLTKSAEDFLWAAGELKQMGYDEVNWNLGCPSGTVVSKGKGAGMLADPDQLNRLLDEVYNRAEIRVTLKTRLGLSDPAEFERLLPVFAQYPVPLLIIHPRVREDYYKHPIRMDAFEQALACYDKPICFNGGLVTAEGCHAFETNHPQVKHLMIGQGLLADPALLRKAKGGPAATAQELRAFHDELYHTYLEAFANGRNTVFHMKELWSYLCRMFDGGEKLFKQIKKAQDTKGYEAAVDQALRSVPLRQDANWE